TESKGRHPSRQRIKNGLATRLPSKSCRNGRVCTIVNVCQECAKPGIEKIDPIAQVGWARSGCLRIDGRTFKGPDVFTGDAAESNGSDLREKEKTWAIFCSSVKRRVDLSRKPGRSDTHLEHLDDSFGTELAFRVITSPDRHSPAGESS